MTAAFDNLYRHVCEWAEAHGIAVEDRRLKANKAGEFDGRSAVMNSEFTSEERAYYLAHALGSMVRWSLSQPVVQAMFDELRDAKKQKEKDPGRLARAIDRYRGFEIESSQFAVGLLEELGHSEVVESYTNFMRADLEALTQFHRTGRAPVWKDFFALWNEQVAYGRLEVEPFEPKPIPAFTPRCIERQEILQKQAGDEAGSASRRLLAVGLIIAALTVGAFLLVGTARQIAGQRG